MWMDGKIESKWIRESGSVYESSGCTRIIRVRQLDVYDTSTCACMWRACGAELMNLLEDN